MTARPRSTGAQTRDRIVAAAAGVMAELGLANATTKEIAKASGCSEALLYKHFPDKGTLFAAVLAERFPPLAAELARLADRAGQGSVHDTLVDVAIAAVAFYSHGVPMLGSLFADPALLRRHRESLEGRGPGAVNAVLAGYLRREQELGRVSAAPDPDRAADLLVGACFQRGFLQAFGEAGLPPMSTFADGLVRTLLDCT